MAWNTKYTNKKLKFHFRVKPKFFQREVCKTYKTTQENFDLDHLPEQSLEIFRQFSSAGVSRIHGDKETNSRYQHDLLSLEDEAFLLIFDGILDGFHLNCDHGQHLYWDAVELIKTAPGSCLCQSFVNVTNRLKRERRVLRLKRCLKQQKITSAS